MDILADLNGALSAGNYAALPLALIGGLVAGLNPCCLALYPAATNACCSTSCKSVERPFASSLAFVLGVSLAVAGLGSLAVYLGRVATVSAPLRYAIAILPILLGVTQLGLLRLPVVARACAGNTGVSNAFGTGLLLSLVVAPCGTPVLAAMLSYAAFSHDVGYGALLLLLFGLGTGLPLIAVGTAAGTVLTRIAASPFGRWVEPSLVVSMIALGLYLLWRA